MIYHARLGLPNTAARRPRDIAVLRLACTCELECMLHFSHKLFIPPLLLSPPSFFLSLASSQLCAPSEAVEPGRKYPSSQVVDYSTCMLLLYSVCMRVVIWADSSSCNRIARNPKGMQIRCNVSMGPKESCKTLQRTA